MMKWGAVWMLALMLSACASSGGKLDALQRAQYDYSAAIRWNNFEGAWGMVDPDYRARHPISALEFERYKQVKVSRYDVLGSEGTAKDLQARQEVQIDVINEHTQVVRSIRYTEVWRFDPARKAWWVTSGLPDFWAGM